MILEKRRVSELRPNVNNPRVCKQSTIDAVSNSIKEFGYVVPIVVDENNNILAGHTRVKALEKQGISEVEVVVLSGLTEKQKRTFLLADNKLAELNDWDDKKLAEMVKGIEDELKKYGFQQTEFNELFELQNKTKDEDDCPLQAPPVCKLGDKWLLGDHILVCGDSTKEETYKLLMGEEKAEMVFTDPPYNVNYSSTKSEADEQMKRLNLMNDNMDTVSFRKFLTDFIVAAKTVLAPTASVYVCHHLKTIVDFYTTLLPHFQKFQGLTWAKVWLNQQGNGCNPGLHYRPVSEQILYLYNQNEKWNGKLNEANVWYLEREDINTKYSDDKTIITITTDSNTYKLEIQVKLRVN